MSINFLSTKSGVRLDRIKQISRVFMALCGCAAIVMGASTVIVIAAPFLNISFIGRTGGGIMLFQMALTAAGCITRGYGFWCGFKLFGLYSHGELFTSNNIRCIRGIAYSFFLIGLETFAYGVPVLRSMRVPGRVPAGVDFGLGPILAGFLILFIAWIMDEGRKMSDEQELTV